jgi:hypothetical protein
VKSDYVTCLDFQKAMTPGELAPVPVPIPFLRCFRLDVATRFNQGHTAHARHTTVISEAMRNDSASLDVPGD